MKGLKKIALASAIAAVSAGAQAELKALDDSAMGELTGQAGLTIDLETKYTIGEFMYKDAGSVFLKGISLGGNTSAIEKARRSGGSTNPVTQAVLDHGLVDNIRIKLDIAGDGFEEDNSTVTDDNLLDTGFSRVRNLAYVQSEAAKSATGNADQDKFTQAADGEADLSHLQDAGIVDNTAGVTASNTAVQKIGDKKTYGDGDLLIHVSFKDAWSKIADSNGLGMPGLLANGELGNQSYADVLDSGLKSVDFNFSIDAIGLASSDFLAGDSLGAADMVGSLSETFDGTDADASTTVLISDLSINGYLGPVDIHIENKGNGFGKVTGFADPEVFSADDLAAAIVTAAGGEAALAAMTASEQEAIAAQVSGANVLNGNLNYAAGVGEANSKINWNTYVNVTDLDVYLDIAGVYIEDLKINNVRGDVTDLDGNFSFGFAQSNREIYAVRNAAGLNQADLEAAATAGTTYTDVADVLNNLGVDGVAINTTFKGDMEIGALSFGDTGTSIGQLYWTDIESTTNWTISAH